MSNLRGATNLKHIRFIHWMPLLIIWSRLGEPLDDYLQLRLNTNLCHADSNSTPGGWIFRHSSRQDVKQDIEAMAVLLWLGFLAQKATSAGGEELPRQPALSSLSQQPLSSEVCSQHDEGKRTISGIHVINCLYSKTDSRGSTRKSPLFEFKEMGSDTQQLSRLITVFLGVGCHPVPEMKV